MASPTPRSVPDSPAWSARVAPWFTWPNPRATSPRAATTPNCPNPEAKAATATPATARSFQRRNRNPPGRGTGTLPGSALNAAYLVHNMSLRAPMAARGERRDDAPGYVTGTNATADALSRYRGRPGKHGKINQKFVSALSTSNPPGHQRATATGRRADPAQPHGRPERTLRPPVFPCHHRRGGTAGRRQAGQATDVSGTGLAVAMVWRASRGSPRSVRAERAGAEQLFGTAVRSAGLALEHVAAQARFAGGTGQPGRLTATDHRERERRTAALGT